MSNEFELPAALDSDAVNEKVAASKGRFLDYAIMGTFQFAVKQFSYSNEKCPHYEVDLEVTKSDNSQLPVGSETALYLKFTPGSLGKNDWLGAKMLAELQSLVRAIYRKSPTEDFNSTAGLKGLLEKGRIEGNDLKFGCVRTPKPPNKNGEVYPKSVFFVDAD